MTAPAIARWFVVGAGLAATTQLALAAAGETTNIRPSVTVGLFGVAVALWRAAVVFPNGRTRR